MAAEVALVVVNDTPIGGLYVKGTVAMEEVDSL